MSNILKHENSNPTLLKKTYTNKEKDALINKLITARIGLLLRFPFFGNMATRLVFEDASHWCKTIATDGRKFYYNLDFLDQLTVKVAEFGFAHEVIHNIFDHIGRRESRDPEISGIAADYAANQICRDEKIGEFPTFMEVYQDDKYRDWTYEQIYEDLENNNKGKGSGKQSLLDMHIEFNPESPPITDEERKQIRDEIIEAMLSAAETAGADKLPYSIKRLIQEFLEPKMDWREMLRMNIQSIFKHNYSFARFNRKSQMTGAILPGMMNEETIDVAVALDMSGSISNKQAKEMISEVKGIMEEYKDFKLKLWCFDDRVHNYKEFSSDNWDEIAIYEPKGGGGTTFEVNWEFMKEKDINPKKFIMFTDGIPNATWGDEYYTDVVFIIHGNPNVVPPFGQVGYYE